MDHRDALMSEITVVVDETPDNTFDQIVIHLKSAGLSIDDADADNGAIDGTCESNKLPDLRAIAGVKYIRVSMEYIADFPSGDPRDLDSSE